MMSTFTATSIEKTVRHDGLGLIEMTLADASGKCQTIKVPLDVLRALQSIVTPAKRGPEPTKLPKRFAVGSGKYEPVVLVRFEDDIPYGLSAADALTLGQALIEQSTEVDDCRPALVQ